jgi:hypothetical protein
MLDPLTAVSLAGTVVQFLDFSAKLVEKGHQIYRSEQGALSENLEIELVTADLFNMIPDLQKCAFVEDASASVAVEQQRALQDTILGCETISKELLVKLQKLKVNNKTTRAWKSFRQALKSVTQKGEIDDIAKRLERYREQLKLKVLISLV